MNHTAEPLHFFLGANTPQGFVSRFDQLADPAGGWREFVIKGGPGTGKSTLMKRVAAAAEGRCEQIELIHCSSDADSLDGVILHDVKTSIADGTSPHAGVPNIINLTSAGGRGKLTSYARHPKLARYPDEGLSAAISLFFPLRPLLRPLPHPPYGERLSRLRRRGRPPALRGHPVRPGARRARILL